VMMPLHREFLGQVIVACYSHCYLPADPPPIVGCSVSSTTAASKSWGAGEGGWALVLD
jgi:hypothetical protein